MLYTKLVPNLAFVNDFDNTSCKIDYVNLAKNTVFTFENLNERGANDEFRLDKISRSWKFHKMPA